MAIIAEERKIVPDRDELSLQWDAVVPFFSQSMGEESNYLPGKDNYDNVWPFLNSVILTQLNSASNEIPRICDFGCGTGTFAEQLNQLKYHTYACDFSSEMISQAKKHAKGDAVYEVGSTDFLRKYYPFNLVIAVMVFQFIPDLDDTIRTMVECIDKDGLLFFAVHHIDYAYECARCGVKFRIPDATDHTEVGEIFIGNTWIRTFIRSPEWYDNLLARMGFVRVGYTLSDNNPPEEVSEIRSDRWTSSKYYIAWYKLRNNS